MRIETPHFAFELPDGFVQQPAESCWSAVNESTLREITLSALMMRADADVEDVLSRLLKHRQDALRANGAEHVTEPTFDDRDDLRVATFMAVGKQPLLSFTAMSVTKTPVLDQRCVVTSSLHQHAQPGAGAPNVRELERLAREIADTVEPMPQRAALQRGAAQGDRVDVERIYPYLVPRAYLETRAAHAPLPASIGHGLHRMLAEDFDGAARIHAAEDLHALGRAAELFEKARSNLARAASEK